MTSHPDKRVLIAVLIFGVVGTAGGTRWLTSGSIVIREGATRVGAGGKLPPPVPHGNSRVAGTIDANHVLYYPLCVTWIALGVSMIALSVLSFLVSNVVFFKLSSYSCVAFLLLGAVTVAAALGLGR